VVVRGKAGGTFQARAGFGPRLMADPVEEKGRDVLLPEFLERVQGTLDQEAF
jgi:hypothetical protein